MVQVYENLFDKVEFLKRNLFNEIEANEEKALISGIKSDKWVNEYGKLSCIVDGDTYIILLFPEKRNISISVKNIKILMDDKGNYHLVFNY